VSRLPSKLASGGAGYTLVELVTVLATLGIVLGAITTVFVRATGAEVDANSRFQAQQGALVALARLRRDVHCATSITPVGAAAAITLSLPSACVAGGAVSWCTVASGSQYDLYRAPGSTCNAATGVRIAEQLTSATPFSYVAPVSGTSLGVLHVDLALNARALRSADAYELRDDIVLRNTTRT